MLLLTPTVTASVVVEEAPHVSSSDVVAVLREKEGGSDCASGASGESGCFQYMPSTWEAYSTEVFGEVVPMTRENEIHVTQAKIQNWLDEGYTPEEIFKLWNQGNTGECVSGINKYGVPYDSCEYVREALELLYESTQT